MQRSDSSRIAPKPADRAGGTWVLDSHKTRPNKCNKGEIFKDRERENPICGYARRWSFVRDDEVKAVPALRF